MLFSPRKKTELEEISTRNVFVGLKNFPNLKVKKRKVVEDPFYYNGPQNEELSLLKYSSGLEIGAFQSVSTLPILESQRQGDPIADSLSFFSKNESFKILAITVKLLHLTSSHKFPTCLFFLSLSFSGFYSNLFLTFSGFVGMEGWVQLGFQVKRSSSKSFKSVCGLFQGD